MSSASTSSPTWTSASASPAVVTPRRSTPSVKPSPSPSSPTTRSSSTSTPRTCSSRPSSSSTAPFSSPTTVAASPRSSAVPARVPATRSPTDKGVRAPGMGQGTVAWWRSSSSRMLGTLLRGAVVAAPISRWHRQKGIGVYISPGQGMGYPLAFAEPCFWRIVTGLTGK